MKKLSTRQSEIWLDDDNILWVRVEGNAHLDLEEVINCFDSYRNLGLGKIRVAQVLDLRQGASMTLEAKNYVKEHGLSFFFAVAVISNSLAVRLIVNFFSLFHGQSLPLQLFSTEKEAVEWLKKIELKNAVRQKKATKELVK